MPGIKYQRFGDESFYAQELFETDTGATLVDQIEKNIAVKVHARLPGWFTAPTPLGGYNPDWAVLVDSDAGERVCLVAATKAGTLLADLRLTQAAKIECGKAHCKALRCGEASASTRLPPALREV